jgi:energy-converting hydrogenase Eha subunit C
LERVLIFALLGIPVLMVSAVYFLPGSFKELTQGTSVCVVNTNFWGVFIAFSILDWCFNIGFVFLFVRSLSDLINAYKNAKDPVLVEKAYSLVSVAKRNLLASVLSTIPSTIQIGLLLYAAASTNTQVALVAQSFSPISVLFFNISVVLSTSKAWKFRRTSKAKDVNNIESPTSTKKLGEPFVAAITT